MLCALKIHGIKRKKMVRNYHFDYRDCKVLRTVVIEDMKQKQEKEIEHNNSKLKIKAVQEQ